MFLYVNAVFAPSRDVFIFLFPLLFSSSDVPRCYSTVDDCPAHCYIEYDS